MYIHVHIGYMSYYMYSYVHTCTYEYIYAHMVGRVYFTKYVGICGKSDKGG